VAEVASHIPRLPLNPLPEQRLPHVRSRLRVHYVFDSRRASLNLPPSLNYALASVRALRGKAVLLNTPTPGPLSEMREELSPLIEKEARKRRRSECVHSNTSSTSIKSLRKRLSLMKLLRREASSPAAAKPFKSRYSLPSLFSRPT